MQDHEPRGDKGIEGERRQTNSDHPEAEAQKELNQTEVVENIMERVGKPLKDLRFLTDGETYHWDEFVTRTVLPTVEEQGQLTPEMMANFETYSAYKGAHIRVASGNQDGTPVYVTGFFAEPGQRQGFNIASDELPAAVVISRGEYFNTHGQNTVISPSIDAQSNHLQQRLADDLIVYPSEDEGIIATNRNVLAESARQLGITMPQEEANGGVDLKHNNWQSLIQAGNLQQYNTPSRLTPTITTSVSKI